MLRSAKANLERKQMQHRVPLYKPVRLTQSLNLMQYEHADLSVMLELGNSFSPGAEMQRQLQREERGTSAECAAQGSTLLCRVCIRRFLLQRQVSSEHQPVKNGCRQEPTQTFPKQFCSQRIVLAPHG